MPPSVSVTGDEGMDVFFVGGDVKKGDIHGRNGTEWLGYPGSAIGLAMKCVR